MTAPGVRIRCHELRPLIGDLAHNLAMVTESVRRAAQDGVDLLVLPELVTSGYSLTPDEARACALVRDAEEFGHLAAAAGDACVVLGFCEVEGGRIHNSAAILGGGVGPVFYRKTHLWDTEKELFGPGDTRPPVVETRFGKLAVAVCYDMEFPEVPRQVALAGADILAVPTNWPLLVTPPAGEHAPEVISAMASARASALVIACCDRAGQERGVDWTQGTCVVGSDGWVLGGTKEPDGVLDVLVSLSEDRFRISPRNHVLQDRRTDLY